jgi:hypothetical protein
VINKTNQIQFRVTTEQEAHLDKAWAHYMRVNEDPISRSEFIRRMIMIACAMELGMIEVKNEDIES